MTYLNSWTDTKARIAYETLTTQENNNQPDADQSQSPFGNTPFAGQMNGMFGMHNTFFDDPFANFPSMDMFGSNSHPAFARFPNSTPFGQSLFDQDPFGRT